MFLLPLTLTIFGFSISSAESERPSGGAAAGVASTFLLLAGFFAALATASALAGVDSETASAGVSAPTATSGAASATSPFEALVGFFAFDVSALDLVVFDSVIRELDFAGFRLWVSDHTHGLARALARARIGRCPLAAHRQAAAMSQAAITIDRLQALQVALDF